MAPSAPKIKQQFHAAMLGTPATRFTPYGTDSIGTVLSVGRDKEKTVTFSYAHAPEARHTYPLATLDKIAKVLPRS